MLERKDLFNTVYDKYVAPCDCQCPINKTSKSVQSKSKGKTATTQETPNGGEQKKGWFG